MVPTRRQILKGIGIGVTVSLVGRPATANTTDRVFVHPETGLLADVLTAVQDVGGTIRHTYDHFSFVAAEIPTDRRDDLRSDLRVAFLEDDGEMGVPSGWIPSIPALLDPGGEVDCSAHPEQQPSWGWERIGADAAEPDGKGVDVGILDTGIESDHCCLSVAGGRNVTDTGFSGDYEDRHGHGTHVAGITGALDNEIGVVGVAPGCNLYAVKVLDDNGSGRYSSLVAGIDWCMANDIELMSMSLGGGAGSSTVDQAIADAEAAGHLLLSAAGNNENNGDGTCDEETMTYPATHEDVVAISAMDEDDTLASYSSVGAAIDLLAPGTAITSTYVDNRYATASGTSAACPFVTGVAALVWQTRDDDGPGPNRAVRSRLAHTAERVLGTCEEGDGLANARSAVDGDGDFGDDHDQTAADEQADQDGDGADQERTTERRGGTLLTWLADFVGWIVELLAGIFEAIRNLFR